MHDECVDVGGGNARAVTIAAKWSLDLGAVHPMTLEEPIQLGIILG